MSNYPLGQHEADTITSKTGKKLSQITLDEVKRGNVTAEDIKISAEMLKRQGQVAAEADNPQMEANRGREGGRIFLFPLQRFPYDHRNQGNPSQCYGDQGGAFRCDGCDPSAYERFGFSAVK